MVTTYGTLRRDVALPRRAGVRLRHPGRGAGHQEPRVADREGGAAAARAHIAWRSPARRSRTTWASWARSSSSSTPGCSGRLPALDVLAGGREASREELASGGEGHPAVHPAAHQGARCSPTCPPKTEQVLLCSLRPEQRALYDQLRAAYRASLLTRVESKGIGGGSTIQVLEALLRLRQVACHPGLVDPDVGRAPAAPSSRRCSSRSPRCSKKGTRRWSSRSSPSCSPACASSSTAAACPTPTSTARRATAAQVVERFQTDPKLQPVPDQPQGRRRRPQPDGRRATSSCSTRGGTRRSRRRRSTAPTASARPSRCSPTA